MEDPGRAHSAAIAPPCPLRCGDLQRIRPRRWRREHSAGAACEALTSLFSLALPLPFLEQALEGRRFAGAGFQDSPDLFQTLGRDGSQDKLASIFRPRSASAGSQPVPLAYFGGDDYLSFGTDPNAVWLHVRMIYKCKPTF